jgi:hypothetical protein
LPERPPADFDEPALREVPVEADFLPVEPVDEDLPAI